MPDMQDWLAKQEQNGLYKLHEGQNNIVEKFFESGIGNRRIGDHQARINHRMMAIASYMGWGWAQSLVDMTDDLQLGCSWPKAGRDDGLEAVIFEKWSDEQKSRPNLDLGTTES